MGNSKAVVGEQFDKLAWNLNKMNGQSCIRSTRFTVRRVVEDVATSSNREDLFRNYPELELEDVREPLSIAAASFTDNAVETTPA